MKQTIIVSLIVLGVIACHTETKSPATETIAGSSKKKTTDSASAVIRLSEEQYKLAGIATATPELKRVNKVLKVNGTLEAPPENKYTISFPLGGFLKSNHLIPGLYVKKGTLLATMEDAAFIQLQQDYLLNKSKLEFLEADYYRQQELNKSQSNSQRTFQQARADYESQKVTGRALAEKLRLIGIDPDGLSENNLSRTVHIYAPISGYISKVNANSGKYVAPTDVLFELIDPSKVHVSLTVFENDAAALKRGQKVYCSNNANPGKKVSATIELITPNFNESRAVEVHCHFDKQVSDMLPGSFINAEIMLDNQLNTAIPNDAIVKWQSNYFIFMEETPRNYKMMQVQIGNSMDGFTEIKTGLPSTSKVVTSNAYALLTMMKNTPEQD
jgi:cobalt-zinc-cadmium efflux system membrane fusion protein